MMHAKLKNFNIFSFNEVLQTEAEAKLFAEEVGLVPKSTNKNCPACPECGSGMKPVKRDKTRAKMEFEYICSKNNLESCNGTMSALKGTFMENARISFRDVLVILFCFVMKVPVVFLIQNMVQWRKKTGQSTISSETVCDYYCYCREVAEVYASHHSHLLGGEGKTIELDETFLNTRKYNRGRLTSSMTRTILGIYCRDDKEGLFFLVNGKKKVDLWPRVAMHCHPDTTFICTDSAKQYHGVQALFNDFSVHKTTNHSKGEYVSKTDKSNTINSLEGRNRWLKKDMVSRKDEKTIRQYMALYYYRRTRLGEGDFGDKIWRFLQDVKSIYPGPGKKGLEMKCIDDPTPESMDIAHLMPKKTTRKRTKSRSTKTKKKVADSSTSTSDLLNPTPVLSAPVTPQLNDEMDQEEMSFNYNGLFEDIQEIPEQDFWTEDIAF